MTRWRRHRLALAALCWAWPTSAHAPPGADARALIFVFAADVVRLRYIVFVGDPSPAARSRLAASLAASVAAGLRLSVDGRALSPGLALSPTDGPLVLEGAFAAAPGGPHTLTVDDRTALPTPGGDIEFELDVRPGAAVRAAWAGPEPGGRALSFRFSEHDARPEARVVTVRFEGGDVSRPGGAAGRWPRVPLWLFGIAALGVAGVTWGRRLASRRAGALPRTGTGEP